MLRTPRLKTGLVLTSFAALLAGVAGCGAGDGHAMGDYYDIGRKSEATTKKCGADRYNGPQGMDVSSWQGSFTFTGKGLAFAIARVSDGTQYPDPQFASNWSKMKAAGLVRGAYQFFEPAQDATAQANMVVKAVGKLGAGDLPCTLDFEKTGGQSASTIVSKIKTWMSVVEAGTGKKGMIYTTGSFWESNTGNNSGFSQNPLWVAHWGTTCPNIPTTWSNWTFWQYCDGQSQYCSNATGVDRDVFNGTLAQLKAFAGGSGTVTPFYGASYVNQSWPLASTALQMQPNQTIASYITLKNTGTAAWDSNTRLGTTNPRDRASAFSDSSWINDHRAAGVSGTVAPGGTYKFQFNLHAPMQTGDYHEYFNLVEEGKAWFSDAGQGGPPDKQIQAWIHVSGTPVGTGGTGGAGGAGGAAGAAGAAGSSSGGTAGTPGTGGSGAFPGGGTAGAAGSTESSHTLSGGNDSGGCGCRLADSNPSESGAPLLLLLGLGWIVRRRRS